MLGCTTCSKLSSALDLPIPRSGWRMCYSPAQLAAPTGAGLLVCCFSLPRVYPTASLAWTGTDPWGLWWNPRPPQPFQTSSCCGQCPLSSFLEKACSSVSCPGGLSLALGCLPSPIPIPAFSCSQMWMKNPSHTLHPLNPLYWQGMDRERFLFSRHGAPLPCSWHMCPCSSVVLPLALRRTLLHSLGSCHGRRCPPTPSCCLCPTQLLWKLQGRMSPFSQSSYHGVCLSC